jgi:hypothetical protein
MNVHGLAPEPNLHRPESLADIGKPRPVVADSTGEQAEMLVTIKNTDALAELANVDPEQLARIKDQGGRL